MPTPLHLRLRTEDPDNILSPLARMVHDQCERRNLDVRRKRQYTAVVLHFGYWLFERGVATESFTTEHIESFLTDHANGCSCSCFWKMRTEVEAMRRALNLAVRMRALREIPPMNLAAIDREVLAFDKMLEEVWGLSAGSRRKHRNVVPRLLVGCVKDGRVDIANLNHSHIRQFVLGEQGRKPATIRSYSVSIRLLSSISSTLRRRCPSASKGHTSTRSENAGQTANGLQPGGAGAIAGSLCRNRPNPEESA